MSKSKQLLTVDNLKVGFTQFEADKKCAWAVDDVSFTLDQGKSCYIVGESGCGKSITSLAIMGLLPNSRNVHLGGEVFFNGMNLLKADRAKMDLVRGKQIGMIFQEPMTSLNPVVKIGEQVAEPLVLHYRMNHREALEKAVLMLEKVGIRNPKLRAKDYPHQLSGGMRQRVMIAMAMICNPNLLIADEPTTALDVTLQAQILDLMFEMQEGVGSALIMITHDFDVVARASGSIHIMYSGKIVESGDVQEVLKNPTHPYTKGLLGSRPELKAGGRHSRLKAIPGVVPPPLNRPLGCAFAPRCSFKMPQCDVEMPSLKALSNGQLGVMRMCRCFLDV